MEPSASAHSSVSKTQKLQSNYSMMEDNELQHEDLCLIRLPVSTLFYEEWQAATSLHENSQLYKLTCHSN